MSDRGEFVLANTLCMESPESTSHKPHLSKCHEMGGLQEWKYHDDVNIFFLIIINLSYRAMVTAPASSDPFFMNICLKYQL